MKKIFNVIVLFMVVIILPFLTVSCFTGFIFNMNLWSDGACVIYILETIFLGASICAAYDINQL